MCKHSYHQRCLQDTAESTDLQDCPLCARENGMIKEIQRANERLIGKHDWLLEELQESDDPFSVIASQFGKGQIRSSITTGSGLT
jgi:phosphodiesterase/alkaline phosphatase D-like protein